MEVKPEMYQELYFEKIHILSKPVFSQELPKVEKPSQEPFQYHTLVNKVDKLIKDLESILLKFFNGRGIIYQGL